MTSRIERNRNYLADLFGGPFPGHAVIMSHEAIKAPDSFDYACSAKSLDEWLPWVLRNYEAQVEQLEVFNDDSVPFVDLHSHTGIFASAFGCPVVPFEDSNSAAMPIVTTPEEAEKLTIPSLDSPPLARYFELAEMIRERVGPEVPISVPDIQSPFDIAALVWRKEDLFVAMVEQPDAVMRLVEKCHLLLKRFLAELMLRHPQCNMTHCPNLWAPPELGCSLSEDEAGALSTAMFERFCLPWLVDLSETFGGMFLHCCADADHQHAGFNKIPNLRAVNRVFTRDPLQTIVDFSGKATLTVAWTDLNAVADLLQKSLPDTRWLFNMGYEPMEQAKRTYERLRELCPRLNS